MAHHSLRNHRKLRRLMRTLKVSRPTAVGLLVCWWWEVYEADGVGADGVLYGWDSDDISEAAGWHEETDRFIKGLQTAGFLDELDGNFSVHDLERWAPDYVKKRWLRRQETTRRTTADNGGHSPDSGSSRCRVDLTKPNLTKPNQTKPLSSSPSGDRVRAAPVSAAQIEAVYQAYPRHVGKGNAVKVIKVAIREVGYAELLAAVKRYATARNGEDTQFTPHPATWFRAKRWLDEPDAPKFDMSLVEDRKP